MAKMVYTPSAAPQTAAPPATQTPTPPNGAALSEEDQSKDAFFVELAKIAEAMIARHGKEFAMGTLILSARFIAENKPLIKKPAGAKTQ
jgi:hypothetical protein